MVVSVQSSGCSLFYKVEGSGEPVVFIQGVGLHGDGWLPQTQTLAAHFRCVTFDNRGMGHRQPPGAGITVEQMAEDALAIMDAAGIGSAHLVGHSLGGAVALQMALATRQRVRSLSLLCTSARGADATKLTFRMFWLGLGSRVGTRRMAERLRPLFGHDLGDTPAITMRQLKALQRFDATACLRELEGIPTLVLSAAHDLIFPPACGRDLAAGIPGARFVEMAGAAHGVTIQSAEAVNGTLREHVSLTD